MAEIGSIPPAVPPPSIRPQHVPAEERDKKRHPPQDEQKEEDSPEQEKPQSPPTDKEPGDDDAQHIDVFV